MDAYFQFEVTIQQNQMGLLDCLAPSIPYLDAPTWLSLLSQGHIQVDGKVVYEDCLLKEQQLIRYCVPNYSEASVDTDWSLLWHNEHIAAIHKPANLPVSRTTRNVYNTLIQLLRRESPWPDAHLLHRLDLETSGIILIAQTNEVAKQYQSKLPQLMQRKIYHAVIHGEPQWDDKRHSSYLNTQKDSAIRCQMHSVGEDKGKFSETDFKVLNRANGYALVQCELLTGRKHQIRSHLSELGHPIVGDKIYSKNGEFYLKRLEDALTQQDLDNWLTEHHLLHAHEIHLSNLWQDQGDTVVIRDDHYPKQWQLFCERYDLQIR